MTARNASLSLPWSASNYFRGKNGHQCGAWQTILYIFKEGKNISTTKELAEFLDALLTRKRERDNYSFSALRCAVDEKLSNDERVLFFTKVLPWMKDLVLQGPKSMDVIPLMTSGKPSKVILSRKQIFTLLVCSFFSLFPFPAHYHDHFWRQEKGGPRFPNPNMCAMLSYEPTLSQVSKVYAFLLYFITCYEHRDTYFDKKPATFTRTAFSAPPDFSSSCKILQSISLTNELIENDASALQAIFANKLIGGGVLGRGCVQEEIRLVISPELLVSLAFCEELGDSEALFCEGSEQFVTYAGYARVFEVTGRTLPPPSEGSESSLAFSRSEGASVVWMDAISFRNMPRESQYTKFYLDREMNKSYIAFFGAQTAEKSGTPVATGNWGCGAFCGDPQLKILLQWCSASQAECSIRYSVFDQSLDGFDKVCQKLTNEKWSVGKLYNALVSYESSRTLYKDIMDYILQLQ